MDMKFSTIFLAIILLLAPVISSANEFEIGSIMYMKMPYGYKGFVSLDSEYVEYDLHSSSAQMAGGGNVNVSPAIGGINMVFAQQKYFAPTSNENLLEAHIKWELDHWRQSASKVESKTRFDLSEGRSGILVTEVDMAGGNPEVRTKMYMIGVAVKDGVVNIALSNSRAFVSESSMIKTVKEIVSSIKLVHKTLTQAVFETIVSH